MQNVQIKKKKDKKKKNAVDKSPPPAVPLPPPPKKPKPLSLILPTDVPCDDPKLVCVLKNSYGLDSDLLQYAYFLPEELFGPKLGLSNSTRVHRAFTLGDGRLGVGLINRLKQLQSQVSL